MADVARPRDWAASVTCRVGRTRLVEMMDLGRAIERLRVVVYIGDVMEELLPAAVEVAKTLRLRGCRAIVLHDTAAPAAGLHRSAFGAIADAGGGCVMPFKGGSIGRLREMLEALAVLAAGGVRMLQERQKVLPAATLLLGHLGEDG